MPIRLRGDLPLPTDDLSLTDADLFSVERFWRRFVELRARKNTEVVGEPA